MIDGMDRAVHHDPHLHHQVSGVEFDRAGVAAHAKNLANKVKGGLEGSLKTLGVEVVDATGELAGANTVKAVETGKTFTAKDIILAPGSLPFVPPGVQVDKAFLLLFVLSLPCFFFFCSFLLFFVHLTVLC